MLFTAILFVAMLDAEAILQDGSQQFVWLLLDCS